MKYLKVPEDVVLGKDKDGNDVTISFCKWIEANPLNDAKFGKTASDLRMAVNLASRLSGKSAGEEVPLEDAEWEKLNDVIENPTSGYITQVAKMIMPFMDAVRNSRA